MSEGASVKRIVRASHDKQNPYFMMLRSTAQNKNLSYEARGLIAYLLSKPDEWEIMIEDLCQECGRGRVYRIIKDLLEDNYLERIYHRDELGKIVYVEYVVHEQPFIENPQMANPKVGKPKVGNRTLHNTDGKKKKEKAEKKEIFTALIKAWLDVQGSKNSGAYKNDNIKDSARDLFASGITAADVTAFTTWKKTDKFWADKFISFEHVANEICGWKSKQSNGNHNGNGRKYTAQQQILIAEQAANHNMSVEDYLVHVEAMQK